MLADPRKVFDTAALINRWEFTFDSSLATRCNCSGWLATLPTQIGLFIVFAIELRLLS